MPRIGLRELNTRASEVLRDVEENRVRYVITKRGQPQAIIIPSSPEQESVPLDRAAYFKAFLETLDEVGRQWSSPLSAQEIIDAMRR
jgi:prevent-host-death family protein